MIWSDALEAWRRIDGTLFFGVAVYLYLSRRAARRKLARAVQIVGSQEASIQLLIVAARQRGLILSDPRESEQEPQRLH
jgi:hypothetical protein